MPAFLEAKLRKEGQSKGFKRKKLKDYIYGGMNTAGAMHGNQETAKGKAMQRKHERDS